MSYFRAELNSLQSIIHALTAVNKSKLLDEDRMPHIPTSANQVQKRNL